jgi:hypothetical protein
MPASLVDSVPATMSMWQADVLDAMVVHLQDVKKHCTTGRGRAPLANSARTAWRASPSRTAV